MDNRTHRGEMEEESLPIPRERTSAFITVPAKEDLAFRAVACNNLETLKRLIDDGYEVNTLHEENLEGPFFVIHDSSRMVRQICLKHYTMLHVAVVHASVDIIKFLIAQGADVNLPDVNKLSPLSVSAILQRSDVASVLINAGANVNMQSISGKTPLFEACANGCVGIVNLLIKAGCDMDLPDFKDTSPLFMCLGSSNGHRPNIEVLKSLIRGGVKLDLKNKYGATALLLAVGMGLKDSMQILLEAGADINLSDKTGKTAIHFASGPNTAVYLLNHGAACDTPDKKDLRPLDMAVKRGHIGLMRVLLEADCKREYNILDNPSVIQMRQQVPAFDRWLQEELGNPRQLKRLCRQVIRENMSPTNITKIKDLPIPSLVKDFLLAKHLDQSL